MEKVGIFNLETEDVRCDPAVKAAILKKARASAKWNDIPGNHRHYPGIERAFNAILKGATLEELRAIFREVKPPASLSQIGLVFPPVIWEKLGRGERVEAVKLDDGYQDVVEWQLDNGMREPDAVVQAWEVTCMMCGKEHIVREVTSTLYCEDCKPRRTGRNSGGGINPEAIKRKIAAFARAAETRFKQDIKGQQKIADHIDKERAKLGLSPMTKKVRESGPKNWTL